MSDLAVDLSVNITRWTPPTVVHTEEGLKIATDIVGPELLETLCRHWVKDVAAAAGMDVSEFELKLEKKDTANISA